MKEVKVIGEGKDLFLEVDGLRIAQRGRPGTSQVGTWITLEPGWEVHHDDDLRKIVVKYNCAAVH
jgi:hypothetical protein